MIYAKAQNWPILCYYDYDKKWKNSSLFKIVKMDVLACNTCSKTTFLGLGPTLGPPYLFTVPQIQVKLISTQTYLGKILLQSIVALPDFPLSSYSPLKMSKKILKWSI